METITRSTVNCCVCKKPLTEGNEPVRLKRALVCYDCDFWIEKWWHRDDPRVVRIGGQHYLVGPADAVYKAQEGRKFKILFFNGRYINTDNLWHQGRIPAHFKDVMPDNAQFVEVTRG